ncbi:MAG: gamma-glutamyltransferase [Thermogemmata sp.]|uniref:Glutathione hydrolase proenzyme n=1 Tax=Thermogemmata fonticola TaxID=2755323 RepID=A0A7V8VBR5_9BACT|nr:gamma-glutamyltransferase [Thermogemmata fonticola]MBA2225122.1 gamma-glutamyltransferase [Thermogemmata fonticola]
MSARAMAGLAIMAGLCTGVSWAERPVIRAGQAGRSVTLAQQGMVATSHPLAAQIGLNVLQRGGNAVDAAIATSAALGVLEPTNCGIGGDLYALVWDARTQKLYGLNASGRSPLRATRAYFLERGYKQIPSSGPLSWSIPGCVDGWDQLRRRFGSWSWRELLEPSITYAEKGAPVPEVIATYWRSVERMRDPGMRATFLIDDGQGGRRAPRAGDLFRNPELARSYRLIAEQGRDAFYKGDIARRLVEFAQQVGGLWTAEDFERHQSEWVEPVATTYRGYEVWQIPPPGQGIAVLQMLNLLEHFDLARLGPTSADYWHLFVEAKKLAFADRARYYADPQFSQVPVQELISRKYAAERVKGIDMQKARTDVPPGDPRLGGAETVYLCVVDKDRNCVSLIQSNYSGFGSGLAAPGTGFGIQNRGCLFALEEKHPNRLEPGKRPFHTIIPAMVTQKGKPVFVFGVMGGDMQPQGQVQVLVNLLDFGMNVQAAGEAPRIEHVGHPTPTGLPGDPRGGIVRAEPGIPDEVLRELERRGHRVERVRVNGGGYQGIWIHPQSNVLYGGSEARKDGMAVGY